MSVLFIFMAALVLYLMVENVPCTLVRVLGYHIWQTHPHAGATMVPWYHTKLFLLYQNCNVLKCQCSVQCVVM